MRVLTWCLLMWTNSIRQTNENEPLQQGPADEQVDPAFREASCGLKWCSAIWHILNNNLIRGRSATEQSWVPLPEICACAARLPRRRSSRLSRPPLKSALRAHRICAHATACQLRISSESCPFICGLSTICSHSDLGVTQYGRSPVGSKMAPSSPPPLHRRVGISEEHGWEDFSCFK